MKCSKIYLIISLAVLILVDFSNLDAQQIILDKPVKVGSLIAFPTVGDESKYYYLADKARLATDENGTPKFSFIRYVDNVSSAANTDESNTEGEGGGIVHAVVELSVSDEQREEAQSELARLVPNADLVGPIIYKSGVFGLVSSFNEEGGDLTKRVVGLGQAPILDGHKAAISIQLTKLGAKILWESFQMATPDISFVFEMQVEGFKLPQKAIIEANFDQVYNHREFGLGARAQFLGAEIKDIYDELATSGAIKVTNIGADASMEALISTAYNKLFEIMFQPARTGGQPSPGNLASTLGANNQRSLLDRATDIVTGNNNRSRPERNNTRSTNNNSNSRGNNNQENNTDSEEEADAANTNENNEEESSTSSEENNTENNTRNNQAANNNSGGGNNANRSQTENPDFAIMASFEMKKERKSGNFRIDLNKWTTEVAPITFTQNIGDLSNHLENPSVFHSFNLEDIMFKQREIFAFIDGYNADDFGQFINFVTVRLIKNHENGEQTTREIRIDRQNFNKDGNYFKMLYGWKGDNNQEKWFEYEYDVLWSFFGGHVIEQGLQKTKYGAISLTPPLQRRTISMQADPGFLEGVRGVMVNLYFTLGEKEEIKQVSLSRSNNFLSKTVDYIFPSGELDYEYEITWRIRDENGKSKRLNSGRIGSSDSILYVDELPEN